jgi:transcriptional regulator with XRE-family HTH domain
LGNALRIEPVTQLPKRAQTPIARALFDERQRRGMNQREAAEFIHTYKEKYRQWETEGKVPGARFYAGIVAFLGLNESGLKDLLLQDDLERVGFSSLAESQELWNRAAEECG